MANSNDEQMSSSLSHIVDSTLDDHLRAGTAAEEEEPIMLTQDEINDSLKRLEKEAAQETLEGAKRNRGKGTQKCYPAKQA